MSPIVLAIILVLTVLLAVALTGYIFYRVSSRYFDNQQKERLLQMKIDERRETLRTVTPIRLQAYERMVLFLERISPSSLVMRCYQPGMDAVQLRGEMSVRIRSEWEHNLSQQVYMSSEAWDKVRKAKEEMLSLVNASAQAIPADATPDALAGVIFASVAKDHNPIDEAVESLKKEIKEYFE
ncbi:MAG: hypothetical protein IJ620_00210 [Bacteroidales bacterium]|nr:hypothetical protein [Bacteroidales bacterium]